MKYGTFVKAPAPNLPRWPAFSPEGVAAAAESLRAGGLIVAPTESSYCLAASAALGDALGAARTLKARAETGGKALLLLCSSLEQARSIGAFDDRALALGALWPAPLTLIVQPIDDALADALGATGLALRVPACEPARALAHRVGPYTGTSANRAGESPLLDPSLAETLGSAISGVLDAGILPGGAPSTLVDTRGATLVVLRSGAFPEDRLRR